jgi:hypothetical protein
VGPERLWKEPTLGAVEPVPLGCSDCFTDTEPCVVVDDTVAGGAGVKARLVPLRLLLISPACFRTW